jgi:hypothetical protein
MIDAAFDVALEGPMLAIPFWSVVGFGWGATILFRRRTRANRSQWRVRYRIAIGLETGAGRERESGEDMPAARSPP